MSEAQDESSTTMVAMATSMTEDPTTQPPPQIVEEAEATKYRFALPLLLFHMRVSEVPPMLYLKAAGEGLFLTLFICWIITLIFEPDSISDNPLKTRLGYNNLCVGWDVAPANYVAVVLWIPVAYLALRFTSINAIRFQIQPGRNLFGRIANVAFVIGVCLFTLCLVIPPTKSVWLHTLPFIGYILTRYAIVLSLCIEDTSQLPLKTHVFLGIYGVISIALPIIYRSEYSYYDKHGKKSPWPYQITMILDYGWFLCLAVTAKFVPSNMVLERSFQLVQLSESGSILNIYKIEDDNAGLV